MHTVGILQNITKKSTVSYKDVMSIAISYPCRSFRLGTPFEPVSLKIGLRHSLLTMQLTTVKSQAHDSSSWRNEGLSKIISFVIR